MGTFPTDLLVLDPRHGLSLQGAEAMALSLLRGSEATDHEVCASLTLALAGAAPASASTHVATRGHHRTLLDILFTGLESLLVADFDHRNEMADVDVMRLDRLVKLKVFVEPRSGFGGIWLCRAATHRRRDDPSGRSSSSPLNQKNWR